MSAIRISTSISLSLSLFLLHFVFNNLLTRSRSAVGKGLERGAAGRRFETHHDNFSFFCRIATRRNCDCDRRFEANRRHSFFCFESLRNSSVLLIRKLVGRLPPVHCLVLQPIIPNSINFCDIPDHSLGNQKTGKFTVVPA